MRAAFVAAALAMAGAAAAQSVSGLVIEENEKGEFTPIPAANIRWLGTSEGTTTDTNGYFLLGPSASTRQLVISYVGYRSDTVMVEKPDQLTVVLKQGLALGEVEVVYRQKSTAISYMNTLKTETMGQQELFKAACCNLSESFETNPSIDVATTDAVTGTKQIQMLGLDGKYTQITRESMPDVRALNAVQGMAYIPGTWIEGIQVSKGAGTVANGYESITGQINVELKKPWETEPWFINGYTDASARTELNLTAAKRLTPKWWSGVLAHGNLRPLATNSNGDSFADNPIGHQVNAISRSKFDNAKGWEADFGARALVENRAAGEVPTYGEQDYTTGPYNLGWQNTVADIWLKSGYVFPGSKYRSVGVQLSALALDSRSYFGVKDLKATQRSGYANVIYQGVIGSTTHKYRTGASLLLDSLVERYTHSLLTIAARRTEVVPGAFFEYTFSYFEKFSLIAGLRGDFHNEFGFFITPRLHARWEVAEGAVLRLSGGRGQRTANLLTENLALLASSRLIHVHTSGEVNLNYGYALKPEVGWNAGLNFTRDFKLDYKPAVLALEFYHTEFVNQNVLDLDRHPQLAVFTDQIGRSFSTAAQVQFDYELRRRFDVRFAYRWFESRAYLGGQMRTRPFISPHRAFVNAAYKTQNGWNFDATLQYQSPKRIPTTETNPAPYQLPRQSPGVWLASAQVTKTWAERFALYLGVENIFNVRQPSPVLASDDAFGPYFDSGLVWGPIFGTMAYAGFRLSPKAEKKN